MPIDFRNTNLVWTSILVETLYRLGLTTAIICPGSRSAPLTVAFAQHPDIAAYPVLDERSAAFFALGIARQTKRAVALVCTSGTAGANFYPAVIEARESRVPLLVLTADRPPELRDCNAGQAIDQHRLYGTFTNWQTELAVPSLEPSLLAYLRQTLVYAWEQTCYPVSGPVHLNLPLRDPLAPLPQPEAETIAATFNTTTFFSGLSPHLVTPTKLVHPTSLPTLPPQGLIIAGLAQPADPEQYCRAIAHLAKTLHYPVLAEALSPVRNYANLNPYLVTTYDAILRNVRLAEELIPTTVIRVGDMPTSKQLRTWLTTTQPRQWVIDPDGRNLDPLHGQTTHLRFPVEALLQMEIAPLPHHSYCDRWCQLEAQVSGAIAQTMTNTSDLFEGKVAWLLSQVLPVGTPLFISSSMPARDMEFFWSANNSQVKPFFNRGANGIDGSLSTALGMAHGQSGGVMLTGDLALLHDTNGFLLRPQLAGHLTIVLINNNGGGIFEMLPIAKFDPPFETFFATPQAVDFAQLCVTYSVEYEAIASWDQLKERLNPLPTTGVRLLEIRCDRKTDARTRQHHLGTLAANIS